MLIERKIGPSQRSFIYARRNMDKSNWDSAYSAQTVGDYIKEGLTLVA